MAETPPNPRAGTSTVPRSKDLHLLGVTTRELTRDQFGRLSLHGDAAGPLRQAVCARLPGTELVVLSTCNRVEFYLATPVGVGTGPFWSLLGGSARAWDSVSTDKVAHLEEVEAAAHLLRVACGLESDILGDGQILAQVRRARSEARVHKTLGPVLDQLFACAVKTSRRARAETAIAAEDVGVGTVVAERVMEHASTYRILAPRICLLGAGAAAHAVLEALGKWDISSVTVVARNVGAAHRLAAGFGAKGQPWDALRTSLLDADVVIAATSSSGPVVTQAMLLAVRRARRGFNPLVVDLGHRTNVERGRVRVLGLDELIEPGVSSSARVPAVPDVEAIIRTELAAWHRRQFRDEIDFLVGRLYQDTTDALEDVTAGLRRTPMTRRCN